MRFKGDGVIWAVFIALCIVSIIEVFSASSSMSFKSGNYLGPVLKHCGLLGFGVLAMIGTMNISCRWFKALTSAALVLSVCLLIGVFFLGESTNGSQRWMSIMGIQFQPSELAKGALVLSVAKILSAMQTDTGTEKNAFKYVMIVSAVIIIPIAFENLSTAALLSFVVIVMMFVARVPARQLGRLIGAILALVFGALLLVELVGKAPDKTDDDRRNMTEQVGEKPKESVLDKVFHRAGTWKNRINKFTDKKQIDPKDVDLDKDAQVAHANIAIASSNVVGKGPGNSVERDFLSQAFSDFIYAIIIEETGIEGAFVVLFLYIILLFRTATIANRCANAFPALMIMGFAVLLVVQALFNMSVAVGLVPVTGQPLPLISKGGTSTIVNCVYIGMILSVSVSAKKRDKEKATSVPVA